MEKVVKFLIKHRRIVLIIMIVLVFAGMLTIQSTNVNYDLTEYLPEDSMTKATIQVLKDEFSYSGMAEVMVEDVTVPEAIQIKNQLLAIEGVKSIIWLDDVADLTVPTEFIPSIYSDTYYKDSDALFRIEFEENDYSLLTGDALNNIRDLLSDRSAYIAGTAAESAEVRDIVAKEVFGIILIIFPICILILLVASHSWIEPGIYLLVIGISIVLNMGTNFIFNQVSFITHSMTAVLQLAISLDYSLFMFHRYVEETEAGKDTTAAISSAFKQSFSTISASAMTTIAGFIALVFMSYRIGADIGIVLAKGILFSFVSVMILMPVMLYVFRNLIHKTRHRPLIPSYAKLSRFTVKFRVFILVFGVIILVISFMAQRNNTFLYGDTSASSAPGETQTDREVIVDHFGVYNPLILLVPVGNSPAEVQMVHEISVDPNIKGVQALVNTVDPLIPVNFLPEQLQNAFFSDHHSRIVVLLNMDKESPESYAAVTAVKEAADNYYPDEWYLAGKASSLSDIRDSVEQDSQSVMIFSILAVLLIVFLSSRSFSIPVILVAVIQGSIWINMGIPYFQGNSLVFIGYIIISSLQLGATIDYAILLSGRYMEFRKFHSPKEAATSAISTAGTAITVSALILTVAGFTEGFLSKIPSISEIGILLGRGAALSGIMVLFVLPGLLVLFDKVIMKTTLKKIILKMNRNIESE